MLPPSCNGLESGKANEVIHRSFRESGIAVIRADYCPLGSTVNLLLSFLSPSRQSIPLDYSLYVNFLSQTVVMFYDNCVFCTRSKNPRSDARVLSCVPWRRLLSLLLGKQRMRINFSSIAPSSLLRVPPVIKLKIRSPKCF